MTSHAANDGIRRKLCASIQGALFPADAMRELAGRDRRRHHTGNAHQCAVRMVSKYAVIFVAVSGMFGMT